MDHNIGIKLNTSKHQPLHASASTTQDTSVPEIGVRGSSVNDDHEEPLRTRDFNELLAMFSQPNSNKNVSLSRRSSSPGLDLTPVKEQPYFTTTSERGDMGSIIMDSNDRGENYLVSRAKKNLETDTPNNSTILEHSQVRKPVSFEIGLDDCVTRDCVTRDSHDESPSVQNGHETVRDNELSFVDNDISTNYGISYNGKYTGSLSDMYGNISSTTASPSDSSRHISFTTASPPDSSRNISFTTASPLDSSRNISTTTASPPDSFTTASPLDSSRNISTTTASPPDPSRNISFTTASPSDLTRNISSITASLSESSRNISFTTGRPSDLTRNISDLTRNISSTTGSPSDVSKSFSSSSVSSESKSISFEISFDDEPVCKSAKSKTSTSTPSKQGPESNIITDVPMSPCLTKEIDHTPDVLSTKNCSFDISFDDDSPNKSSPKRQREKEFIKKSTPDKVTPPKGITHSKTESPHPVNDNSSSIDAISSPKSLSFEINIDDDSPKTSSPRRQRGKELIIKSTPENVTPLRGIANGKTESPKLNENGSSIDATLSARSLSSPRRQRGKELIKTSTPDKVTPPRGITNGKTESPQLNDNSSSIDATSSSSSLSFEINFDDDSPKKFSPRRQRGKELIKKLTPDKVTTPKKSSPKRQHEKELIKKSTPEKVTTPRAIANGKTESPKLNDNSSSIDTTSSPRSRSFEFNFDGNKRTSPRRPSENNDITKNFPTKHELDVLTGKETDSKDNDMLTTGTTRSEIKDVESSYPCHRHDLVPEKESDDVEIRVDSRSELQSAETATPPPSIQDDGDSHSKATTPSTTHGFSFDISFEEDFPSRKAKLAPKHIRLKMTKTKKQQNIKTQKQSDSVTLRTENTALRITKPEEMRRGTYTLDEVSQTLQNACETGVTLEQALDNLSKSHDPTQGEHLKTNKLDTSTSKRGTYSLDQVSDCLVDAADKGLTVEQALDSLANSQEINGHLQGSKVESSPKRGTYDLNDVSRTIDSSKEKGKSLEEALVQLLDEVESAIRCPQKTTVNRGTYDLDDVSQVVQDLSDQGVPVEESLSRIAEGADSSSREVTSESGSNTTTPVKSSSVLDTSEDVIKEHYVEKRGTYSLDEVAEHLESASERGNSVIETLSNLSHGEAKDIASHTETSRSEEYYSSRNTYTLDEVAQSLEVAKSKGIPVVQALSNIAARTSPENLDTPGSRGTYPLDEVAHSLESARNKGLPVVLALENLIIQSGGFLRGPAEVAVYRRQGKLTNRKTYALASPLETIGEENQLRLFDGTSRKLLPPTRNVDSRPFQEDSGLSAGAHVVQTLDLLTSACEALLKSPPKSASIELEEKPLSKTESRDSGVSFQSTGSERGTYSLDDVSDSLKNAKDKGVPVVEALESLTAPKPVKTFRTSRAIRKAGSKSDSNLSIKSTAKEETARQTYSLEGVSSSVEAAKAKGIPVIAALDELTNSLAEFSATGAKALKNGKKPVKKPDRPSILRKREAARLERSGIKSEAGRPLHRPAGMSFPISYPPALRNSYSLDDVASALEMAYQTGASFQDVLDGKVTRSQQSSGESLVNKSTGSLETGIEDQQLKEDPSLKTNSVSKVDESTVPGFLPSSNSDGQISSYLRKDSASSQGSLSCSSSAGSTKDLSSAEDLVGGKVTRNQRKHSNGPFQLRRTRRNSPANTRRKLNVSPVSSHGDSVESITSLGSESSSSDSLTKRGTYDLKKVSEELDGFKVQGVSIVKGLDKINTNNSSDTSSDVPLQTSKRGTYSLEDLSKSLDHGGGEGHSVVQSLESLSKDHETRKSTDSGITTEDSLRLSQQGPTIVGSVVVESPPKKGTYGLDDISRKIDSSTSEGVAVNKALLELSQGSSAKGTRNTFTLDRVEVSIDDAHKRGVPVVDVLDKLSTSDGEVSKNKTEKIKSNRKPFVKPKCQGSPQDEFFIEYYPSKTEAKSPKLKLEDGQAGELTGEGTEHRNRTEIKGDHPTELHSEKVPKEVNVQASELELYGEELLKVQESSISLPKTQAQTNSESAEPKTATSCGKVQLEEVQELQNTETQSNSLAKDTGITEPQASCAPRPRWQRSGSYVEALDSFEEMLNFEQDHSKEMLILTCPNDQNQSDKIPMKDSQYESENYDVMLPETSSRGRSPWRPSGSVLQQILSLMDDAEENGLSIADALEQAAEMSEKQGEIEESISNDEEEDETAAPQHLALLRLHFEEKRRQIEAEKRRSQEQWEDERRRLGETAFWYTIGRAQGGDKDAGNVRPGHERVHEPASPGQPTPPIGRSTPLDSMSPIQTKPGYQAPTVEGYQSPRGDPLHVSAAIGHGYHQAPLNRPGHQSPAQSGYQSPVSSQAGFQFPSQPATSNFQHGHHDHLHEQEYETREFRLSEYSPQVHQNTPSSLASPQQNTSPSQASPQQNTSLSQASPQQNTSLSQASPKQNISPLQVSPHQNGPMKSPSRKCWDVNPAVPPSPTAVFTSTSQEGVALHVVGVQEEQGGDDNQYEDVIDVQAKKGVAMFIGDESAKPEEGLTPEQHKKRQKFLKYRQKKQEEEKARKDAEQEKKILRELKQKELEEQKRLEDEQREEQQRRFKLSRERLAPSNGGESTYRPGPGSSHHDDHAGFAEFSGPRCYVKPTGKSNRKLITNAISHVCLSGTVNKENKEKCLQAMADSPGFHFIVLFKDGLKFRGLYMLNPETEQGFKVFGIGPKVIASKMVDCVYKYSSGGKEFVKIASKTLSISVDGVAILKTYWQTNKPNVASKTKSNLNRPPRPPQR